MFKSFVGLFGFVNAATREPYRIFFPLGIFMGTLGIGHWLFYSLGWLKGYSGYYHSSMQMLVYMICFIIGFLLTAFPRFSQTPHATGRELAGFLFLILGMALFLSCQQWILTEICFLAWLCFLAWFVIKRIKARPRNLESAPPQEMFWVPIGIFHGITAVILLILAQNKWLPGFVIKIAKPMLDQGFLICVVVGVGSFLIPRIMGTSLTSTPAKSVCACETARRGKQQRTVFMAGGIVLFASFILEGLGKVSWGYALRALVVSLMFLKNRILTWPKKDEMYVYLAWIAAWMISIGYWGAALWPEYRVAWLHVAFIGGFSLMTFAVATMVVMAHAGKGDLLRRPFWVLWVVGLGLAFALFKRVMVIYAPEQYFQFLGMAGGVWVAVGMIWLMFAFKMILSTPEDDEFRKFHDQAAQKISS